MPTFERGFKAWAERTASAVRRELGLAPIDPLDPVRLAEHLRIRVINPLVDLPDLPGDVRDQLFVNDPWGWSAATLQVGECAVVVFNAKRSKGRQASDIIHELAHVMLGHEPTQIVFSEDGELATRTFDQRQEDEANWLGWTLLLPRDALFAAKRSRMADAQIAEVYGVTERLVTYRAQMTGVDVQIRRFRGARRG